jgi:hypothetical protein
MFPDPSRPIPDRRSRLADNTFSFATTSAPDLGTSSEP